ATQMAHRAQSILVQMFGLPEDGIRVITPHVGGGFGPKFVFYQEEAVIPFAAMQLGRPVKWIEDRREHFTATTTQRDQFWQLEVAVTGEGRIIGLRGNVTHEQGAWVPYGVLLAFSSLAPLPSAYSIAAVDVGLDIVYTNTTPNTPVRGAGRPYANYAVERMIQTVARGLGIDQAEVRRRNLIRADQMPYETGATLRDGSKARYDSGDYHACLDKALTLADWDGFAARRATSEKAGRLRGIGIACFLEVAGGILEETADLRFEGDGYATVRLGVQAMGQSHLSTYTRLVGDRLGIPPSRVRLIEGDSLEAPPGTPSVASRSMMMAGSAMAMGCDVAIERGRALAGHVLEAAVEDVEFDAGNFRIRGTDRVIGILDLAERIRTVELPDELAGGMDAREMFESAQMTFPNGCHICEVEIDPDTGALDVARYAAVDDVGNVFDEMVVEGQIHGGIAQGLGQVLGEQVVYDDDGQLMTGSFMDYMMPRADDLPMLDVGHHSVPATTNPLGAKGAGESGVAGALPSGMAAVADALASAGKGPIDLPMTPARIWVALQNQGD
ncbi:MAG: molybdopterin-dependent oxidoreductase, partial [Proteobacteria bacterium]|nr:molybdopterin-dependent oxidoreductase [Pseudomonadota bacterium]